MFRKIVLLIGIIGGITPIILGLSSYIDLNQAGLISTAFIGIIGLILAYETLKPKKAKFTKFEQEEKNVLSGSSKPKIVEKELFELSSVYKKIESPLLPDVSKITELKLDNKLLDNIYERAEKKAIEVYSDAKFNRFSIQVQPFGLQPSVCVYMWFYSKIGNKVCFLQYADYTKEVTLKVFEVEMRKMFFDEDLEEDE